MRKTSGEYSERYEYLADRYRAITYSKRLETTMAKRGFPGEVGFVAGGDDWMAVFYPDDLDIPMQAEGETLLKALANLIKKLLSKGIKLYNSLKQN